MLIIYRLEFNEKQQRFHLNNLSNEKETHGWFTVFEYCSDIEFKIYEAFVNRIPNKKLTKEYLLSCAFEFRKFMSNLLEYNLCVSRC